MNWNKSSTSQIQKYALKRKQQQITYRERERLFGWKR